VDVAAVVVVVDALAAGISPHRRPKILLDF
jgi:hypothetical protein